MIENVLKPKNLTKAYRKVVGNKGAAGIDKMTVKELVSFMENLFIYEDSILYKLPYLEIIQLLSYSVLIKR